ncbi:MAG: radical SAM protein, partial [Dehalococcoidia bacterium]
MAPSNTKTMLDPLGDCTSCPRNCHANRNTGRPGYCNTGAELPVASIVAHQGEEPVISGDIGICNIFFAHCNMQCIYCQNYQISRNDRVAKQMIFDEVIRRVEELLENGVSGVGFVSPSHCIPQMKAIIDELDRRGRKPYYVYNTSSYDKAETLESLDGMIDVYLADLKYMSSDLAARYSGAPDYPEVVSSALKEMFRQKGSNLKLDGDGVAESGLIIRHLILPGHIENSMACLRFIAEELSPSIHVSL